MKTQILDRLKALQRYRIDAGTGYNTGLEIETTDTDGPYVKWEDVEKAMEDIEQIIEKD